MDYTFQFSVIRDNWAYLLQGAWITVAVTAVALAAGLLIGLVLGMTRLSKRKWVSLPALWYVEVFRNTPALVQLMWVYYALPVLTGIELNAVVSCTVALSLNISAYLGEIFRGGIQSIDRGQVEASRSLGMSYGQTMRKVVLPQAIRRMIPPFVNETVALIKYSSLVSILGVADLTYQANVLSTTTFRPMEIFTFIAVVYLVICACLSYSAQRIERRLAVVD
jgi:His/Glu/Gln/Arg/opine family amino acid ABC transporter permease subunit